MEFHLDIHLNIEGTGNVVRGSFKPRNKSEIPKIAYEFIRNIKHKTGYRTTKIEKVMENGSEDITKSVITIENQPSPDLDDIFW